MTTEHLLELTEPRVTDILRRMIDLARQVTPPKSAHIEDSNRVAKIAMEMAINSLDSPTPSPTSSTDSLESMLLRRVAEKKERRWEDRIEAMKKQMWEEREKAMESQELKYEALRKREEAERNRLLEELRRAKEEAARAKEQVDAAKLAAKEQVQRARQEAEQAKKDLERVKEQAREAFELADLERRRADRAEEYQTNQAVQAEARRHSIEEQQDATAWARYTSQWKLFKRVPASLESCELFRFEDFPWPTVIPPESPAMITDAEVAAFLFSGPPLREGETFRSRIKECLLTWHPDKFSGRWMRYVVESDQAKVVEGIMAVTRAGNKALADYTNSRSDETKPSRASRESRTK